MHMNHQTGVDRRAIHNGNGIRHFSIQEDPRAFGEGMLRSVCDILQVNSCLTVIGSFSYRIYKMTVIVD